MLEPVETTVTGPRLYRWPNSARYGKAVPKTKFYEHGKVNTSLRERFVAEVQRITWAYKLAENTINLPGSAAVPEIQVFEIVAKGNDVSDVVLAAIDKAVKTPIFFELSRTGGVRLAAAHKATARQGAYFTTAWLPADSDRAPLPTAINIPSLYGALLTPLVPVSTQAGEDVGAIAERVEVARKLEREIAALERKLRNEPQLNRKVELRRILITKQATLAGLTSRTP
ncbi:MAG: DUF4391 domain-containing protein [Actinomycetota bacterium]|nr:DUF4391 domain-containing protein [Actinomycetota bacterium]